MKISVVIPAYNRAKWLPALLERLSSLSEWIEEIVVIDDGSTDDTAAIVRQHPGIRLLQQTNQGPSAARNLGLQQVSGEWVHFLDSDDVPDATFYASLMAGFSAPSTVMALGNFRTATGSGEVVTPDYFLQRGWSQFSSVAPFYLAGTVFQDLLLRHSIIPSSGVIFRRAFLTVPWNRRVRVGEDRLFLLENLAACPGQVFIDPKPAWTYHVHEANSFHAHPRPDRMAYRDNQSLKHIVRALPGLKAADLALLAQARARNYFDWAWHCRQRGRRHKAGVLLKAAWRLSPNLKILRARLINWISPG